MTAAEAVPNMRERSRRETRRRLIEAGKKLFARRGFARTRATDISREAGVAVGTLYVHFRDKEELLREILFQGFEEIHAVVRRIADTKYATVRESVRAHAEALVGYAAEHPALFQILFSTEVTTHGRRRRAAGIPDGAPGGTAAGGDGRGLLPRGSRSRRGGARRDRNADPGAALVDAGPEPGATGSGDRHRHRTAAVRTARQEL